MTDLFQVIHNVGMLLETVIIVIGFTGAGLGWLVALGYEMATKRRA